MNEPVHVLLAWLLLIQYASPLRVLSPQRQQEKVDTIEEKQANEERRMLRQLLEKLVNTKRYLTSDSLRRDHPKHDHADVVGARQIVGALTQKMSPDEAHHFLTNSLNTHISKPMMKGEAEHNKIVEQELIHTFKNKLSEVYNRPRIETKGQYDFLVMNPGHGDLFTTVIPNNIYYNIEKKCVNWLDDCSLQGIRAKLLHKI